MAMTVGEAAAVLKRMYENAPRGEKSTSLHLFGIKYADDLVGLSVEEVVRKSGIPKSYHVEINKGRRLAKYVQIKGDSQSWQ